MVDTIDDTVARPGRQRADEQGLYGAFEPRSFCLDGDVVFDVTEGQENDKGDADGGEQGVIDSSDGEVWNHR